MRTKKHPQKISRRDLLKASAALSASAAVSCRGGGSTAAPEQTSQPNVLFILGKKH
jgi:TAT (twin-arginine translocation) pathway signal sequence